VELLAHGGALAAETGVIGDQYAGRFQLCLLVYHLLLQVGDLLLLLLRSGLGRRRWPASPVRGATLVTAPATGAPQFQALPTLYLPLVRR